MLRIDRNTVLTAFVFLLFLRVGSSSFPISKFVDFEFGFFSEFYLKHYIERGIVNFDLPYATAALTAVVFLVWMDSAKLPIYRWILKFYTKCKKLVVNVLYQLRKIRCLSLIVNLKPFQFGYIFLVFFMLL